MECTLIQWGISIYPYCTQVAEGTFFMKSPVYKYKKPKHRNTKQIQILWTPPFKYLYLIVWWNTPSSSDLEQKTIGNNLCILWLRFYLFSWVLRLAVPIKKDICILLADMSAKAFSNPPPVGLNEHNDQNVSFFHLIKENSVNAKKKFPSIINLYFHSGQGSPTPLSGHMINK